MILILSELVVEKGFGVLFILLGSLLVIFRKTLAQEAVREHGKIEGKTYLTKARIHARVNEIIFLIIGLVFLLLGPLLLFQVVHFKS